VAVWLTDAAMGRVRVQLRVPRRAFAAITVAPALLAIAWLVPGCCGPGGCWRCRW
jgi:hypothetical protein